MDRWDDDNAYDAFMGRWSLPAARAFISWLDPPQQARWLDVGCGSGAVLAAIAGAAAPAGLSGVDPSPGFVEAARRRLGEDPDLRLGSAGNLPFEADSFDVVVSGLVLNFVPDPAAALTEMRRVAAPLGTVSAFVWDYADGMEYLRTFWDAAAAVDPEAASLDEATRFPLCRPGALGALFEAGGLNEVATSAVRVPTVFADFADYWNPLLSGQGPAPGYVASLDEATRHHLRQRLDTTLPRSPDGTIHLSARAWCATGTT
ncbi:MAG TPA: class I SAM-dependent methyltransferase [Acidimicrobiia bacterium]